MMEPARFPWLFSAPVDLAAFLGSAMVSLLLLAVGASQGWLHSDAPDWTWVGAVLLVDVAHVYATAFRVYFAPRELRRRPWLYLLTPLLAFGLAWAIYSENKDAFWRVLAYLAVFHFVRQQYGWVAMYRARAGERDRLGAWIDSGAIYAATLYPLLYWHAHIPRRFYWFLAGDFVELPEQVAAAAFPIYVVLLCLYFARSAQRGAAQGLWNPGKDIVVATTAICWYVGIVAFNSDYAFMVTNVIIHGVPYMVLVFWKNVQRSPHDSRLNVGERQLTRLKAAKCPHAERVDYAGRVVMFVATLWVFAYAEEFLWDHSQWHERSWLFGSSGTWEHRAGWLAPLLAVPQITHYVLDGFIWRRRSNPDLAADDA